MKTAQYVPPMAWCEIDMAALRWNYRQIKKLAIKQLEPRKGREVDILSVVKADAYGHGMSEAVSVMTKEGGRFFAVSNLEEGVSLRVSGCKARIILFETTLPEQAAALLKYDLTPAICTMDLARALDCLARKAKKIIPVHIKIDTGMGRLGVWHQEAKAFILSLGNLKNIMVEGLFTHFPVADTDESFTHQQIDHMAEVIFELIKAEVPFRYVHAASSMGLLGYKNRFFNIARPGVMLYGLYPGTSLRQKISLKPVMSVKTRVLLTKTIHRGRGISYGHTIRVGKDTLVAVLAIGYSDGYSRSFSNKAKVIVNGCLCPVLGRVTMDQIIVDITRAGKVKTGDIVVVLGRQGKSWVTADDLASWAGTINYEIVCNFGNRMPRQFINKS